MTDTTQPGETEARKLCEATTDLGTHYPHFRGGDPEDAICWMRSGDMCIEHCPRCHKLAAALSAAEERGAARERERVAGILRAHWLHNPDARHDPTHKTVGCVAVMLDEVCYPEERAR